MGIHHFTRAPEYRVPEKSDRRLDEPLQNERSFDSDPYRSLPMAFGYRAGSLELRETGRDNSFVRYDVYAKSGMEPTDGTPDRPAYLVGSMTTKTQERVYAEATGGARR